MSNMGLLVPETILRKHAVTMSDRKNVHSSGCQPDVRHQLQARSWLDDQQLKLYDTSLMQHTRGLRCNRTSNNDGIAHCCASKNLDLHPLQKEHFTKRERRRNGARAQTWEI